MIKPFLFSYLQKAGELHYTPSEALAFRFDQTHLVHVYGKKPLGLAAVFTDHHAGYEVTVIWKSKKRGTSVNALLHITGQEVGTYGHINVAKHNITCTESMKYSVCINLTILSLAKWWLHWSWTSLICPFECDRQILIQSPSKLYLKEPSLS